MKQLIFTSLLLTLLSGTVTAQSIERQVIASAGTIGSSSIAQASWTSGETTITTEAAAATILTQGFQQTTITITEVETPDVPELLEEDWAINVFPNPVANELNLQILGGPGRVQAIIADNRGKIVYRDDALDTGQTYGYDFSRFADGLYFVRVFTVRGKPLKTFKVVKAN